MKARRLLESILYFIVPVGFLLIAWEVLSQSKIIDPELFSSPSEIFITLGRLIQKESPTGQSLLLFHIYSSLYRLLIAFVIAVSSGLGLGLLMGWNNHIYRFLDPLITVAMPVPGLAWTPIFVLWLGFGELPVIAVGALAAFFPIVYNMATGVRSVSKKLVWLSRSMGANERTLFLKVFLPWSSPYLFTGLKLGLARGWRTIIAVELIAGVLSGLGFMVFDAREYGHSYIIYAGIIVLAVIYFLIENLLKWTEGRSIQKWGMVRQ
jgi:ABC-type nitrate/sulfonate/bicarbonate transport system permease component